MYSDSCFYLNLPDVILKSFQYLSVLSHSGLIPLLKRTFQCIKCYKKVWKTVQRKWSSEYRSLTKYALKTRRFEVGPSSIPHRF